MDFPGPFGLPTFDSQGHRWKTLVAVLGWYDPYMILLESQVSQDKAQLSADRLNFPAGLQGLAAISCSSTGILLAMKAWQAMALLVRVEVSGRDVHAKIEYVSIYIHILYHIYICGYTHTTFYDVSFFSITKGNLTRRLEMSSCYTLLDFCQDHGQGRR